MERLENDGFVHHFRDELNSQIIHQMNPDIDYIITRVVFIDVRDEVRNEVYSLVINAIYQNGTE